MTASIRAACTVVVIRDGEPGLEVLLLRRTLDAAFMGGFHVFPGGAAGEDEGARHAFTAAREAFEECGLVLAVDAGGRHAPPDAWAAIHARRADVQAGTASFAEVLALHGLGVADDAFAYFDRWLTPAGRPRRFDTRFFLARAPEGQVVAHDGNEIVDSRWMRPDDALAAAGRDEMKLGNATRATLQMLARHATVDEAIAAARAMPEVEPNRGCIAQGSRGERVFHRTDAAYHEIHWCDPDETMQTTYDLVPGTRKRLDRFVARIVAPNPGPMTGPGTNSYVIGEREVAVIDPGPIDEAHLAALLAYGAGRIRWILCTHTHRDHSPAAAALAAVTGAQVLGMPPPPGSRQDESFAPQRVLRDGETVELGEATLTAIHTPGHASNHLCYRLAQTGMLFTGDHVMQGSTVVIAPPDGNMRRYLASLERLLTLPIAIIAPGHGYLIGAAHREIRKLIEHRLWREARVRDAVARRGMGNVDELLDEVYPDLRPVLRAPAAMSLRAHLDKLVEDGAVREAQGRYRSAVPPGAGAFPRDGTP
ncbi:MAG: MBL fold metallo-hydrolase [Burkholderiales bacterium]|nr:MBL fold metallo-hydrolase [Burkholderiales bacterium]